MQQQPRSHESVDAPDAALRLRGERLSEAPGDLSRRLRRLDTKDEPDARVEYSSTRMGFVCAEHGEGTFNGNGGTAASDCLKLQAI